MLITYSSKTIQLLTLAQEEVQILQHMPPITVHGMIQGNVKIDTIHATAPTPRLCNTQIWVAPADSSYVHRDDKNEIL